MVPATLGNVGYPETPFNIHIYWHRVFVSVSTGFAPWQEHQATCNACREHANQSYNRPIDDVDTFRIDCVSIGEFASLVGWCWINCKKNRSAMDSAHRQRKRYHHSNKESDMAHSEVGQQTCRSTYTKSTLLLDAFGDTLLWFAASGTFSEYWPLKKSAREIMKLYFRLWA